MFKIIDKKNQIEQLTRDIIISSEQEHYVILKDNGLLYITDKEDMTNCISNGSYKYLGLIIKDSGDNIESIKTKLINII